MVVSSYGDKKFIVTSDKKKINKNIIEKIFFVNYPTLRQIPAIFMYVYHRYGSDIDESDDEQINVDSKLIVVNASAKLQEKGSFVIRRFISKMGANIKKADQLFLSQILDQTQELLLAYDNKQVMDVKYNNNQLEYTKFRHNKNYNTNLHIDDDNELELLNT